MNEQELKIVATIVTDQKNNDFVYKELKTIVKQTLKEEGNISYVLHRDLKNPFKYIILEHWKDQAAIDFHNNTTHFKDFGAAIKGKIEGIDVSIIQTIF